jgi:small subunit ribosomal protein S5
VADETAQVAPAPAEAGTPPAPAPATEGARREGGYGGGRGDGRGGRGGGGGRGPRRRDGDQFFEREQSDLVEKVIFINRSSKVVKGGRRFSFSALVVVGDKKGKVGLGLGKAGEVADAIRKGNEDAKHSMLNVSLKDTTIPHEVFSEYGGARILLRPASPGTGIIAGKTVRAVVESAGVKDILSKSLGSKNAANVAKATLTALQSLRLREQIFKDRGIQIRQRPKQGAAPVEQVTT